MTRKLSDRRSDTRPPSSDHARSGAPKWLRILLPALLIVVWLAGAAVGGPYFGKVGEVASNDQTS